MAMSQISVEDQPFNFRGRPKDLVFKKPPSQLMPQGSALAVQPELAVIDYVDDQEPQNRPREGYDFFYWEVALKPSSGWVQAFG